MAGPITEKARQAFKTRIPTGSYNQYTGQIEASTIDGHSVAGMVEPLFVAIEELEAKLDALTRES